VSSEAPLFSPPKLQKVDVPAIKNFSGKDDEHAASPLFIGDKKKFGYISECTQLYPSVPKLRCMGTDADGRDDLCDVFPLSYGMFFVTLPL
jgi:hypothetical protein